MNLSGHTNRRSRVTHVVPGAVGLPPSGRVSCQLSACGRLVEVSRYEAKESTEVCLKCRHAMGWPMITSWESHGIRFTDNWSTGEQFSERI
jgi:hypothetical protein